MLPSCRVLQVGSPNPPVHLRGEANTIMEPPKFTINQQSWVAVLKGGHFTIASLAVTDCKPISNVIVFDVYISNTRFDDLGDLVLKRVFRRIP